MASLVAAAQSPSYPAAIAVVVSNRPDAAGLARAQAAGIATVAIDHKLHPDRASFDAEIGHALAAHGVDLVCLAGFMRIFTDAFVVPELDSGPIIAQAAVPVMADDTEDALASRVIVEEHRLYPHTLGLVASGRARLEGGRTVFSDGEAETALGLTRA